MDKFVKESIVNVLKNDSRLPARGIVHKSIITSDPSKGYDLLWVIEENGALKYLMVEFKTSPNISIEDFKNVEADLRTIQFDKKAAMLLFDGEISDSAADYAQKKQIIYSRVQPPSDADWEGRIKEINIKMKMVIPRVRNLKLNLNMDQARILLAKSNKDSFRFSFSGTADQIMLVNQATGYSITLDKVFKAYTEVQGIEDKTQHIHHVFDASVYVDTEIGQIEVTSLDFDIERETIEHPIIVDGSKNIGFAIGFTIVKAALSMSYIPEYKP
jgi:hypothetical protein